MYTFFLFMLALILQSDIGVLVYTSKELPSSDHTVIVKFTINMSEALRKGLGHY